VALVGEGSGGEPSDLDVVFDENDPGHAAQVKANRAEESRLERTLTDR
jgi:hypothetical protein